jgi:hypothetical protein
MSTATMPMRFQCARRCGIPGLPGAAAPGPAPRPAAGAEEAGPGPRRLWGEPRRRASAGQRLIRPAAQAIDAGSAPPAAAELLSSFRSGLMSRYLTLPGVAQPQDKGRGAARNRAEGRSGRIGALAASATGASRVKLPAYHPRFPPLGRVQGLVGGLHHFLRAVVGAGFGRRC